MMEIFASQRGENSDPSRTTGNEITLIRPSDVYFGDATPGIAFYEKSGADLVVTLLDGSEIFIKRFFTVDPNGDFSRLLNGFNGEEEVTGLLAPEHVSAVPEFASDMEESSPDIEQEVPMEDRSEGGADSAAQEKYSEERLVENSGRDGSLGDDVNGKTGWGDLLSEASTLDMIFAGSAGIASLALIEDDPGSSGAPAARPDIRPMEQPTTMADPATATAMEASDPAAGDDQSDPSGDSGAISLKMTSAPTESSGHEEPVGSQEHRISQLGDLDPGGEDGEACAPPEGAVAENDGIHELLAHLIDSQGMSTALIGESTHTQVLPTEGLLDDLLPEFLDSDDGFDDLLEVSEGNLLVPLPSAGRFVGGLVSEIGPLLLGFVVDGDGLLSDLSPSPDGPMA